MNRNRSKMYLKYSFTLALFLQLAMTYGQAVQNDYNRNALSAFVLKEPSAYTQDIVGAASSLQIPDKFDDNNFQDKVLVASRSSVAIQRALEESGAANEIIARWFNRDAQSGEMNMDLIHARGLYNATDDAVVQAQASKRGESQLRDAGEKLINQSYLIVLSYSDIESMREIYNKQDLKRKASAEAMNKNFKPVYRSRNGWRGQVKAYLYKVDLSDSLANSFYNDLWIYADDSEAIRASKKEAFENFHFPLHFVESVSASADGTQSNAGAQRSRQQLFDQLVNDGLDQSLFLLGRKVGDFQVRTPLYSSDPLQAKIGKKEGLYTDQRYFVMETVQKRKQQAVTKRRGVIRAKHVIDNRKVATGNSNAYSEFYQTAGRKLESGMLLQQKSDFGIGISGGYAFGEIGGGWVKAEWNAAQWLSRKVDLGLTQLKFFGTAGFEIKNYSVPLASSPNQDYDFTFIRWHAGISKGFYMLRHFSLAPYVAYGAETGQNSDFNADNGLRSSDFVGSDYLLFGGYATLNVRHNIQVLGAMNYYVPLGYTYTKQRSVFDLSRFMNKTYTDFFADRRGLSFDVGLRVEF